MEKAHIYGLLPEELAGFEAGGLKAQSFRAKQVYSWLYHKYASSFSAMTNLSKKAREELNEGFKISSLSIKRVEESRDGTKKFLLESEDKRFFEAVLILMKEGVKDDEGISRGERYTLCLSSQIGCRIGCSFCSTARGGFVRNLSAGEIVEQVVILKREGGIDSTKSVNIVFMGMGEPLDNLDAVSRAIKILSHKDGLSISRRRHTISTSGLAPQIEKLGRLDLGVQIALSLHAVDDSLRSRLIPLNKAYNIARVLDSLRNFPLASRNRILFEYLVLGGMNDSLAEAKKLVRLLHGFRAKVNLIPFNPHKGSEFSRPSKEALEAFGAYLRAHGLVATIRESRGIDISAACGQLREKVLEEEGFADRLA